MSTGDMQALPMAPGPREAGDDGTFDEPYRSAKLLKELKELAEDHSG